MKKLLWLIGLTLFAFVSVSLASDLADVAKKEKERREKVEAKKTFTNQDVEEFKKKNKIEDEETSEATEGEATEGTEAAETTEEADPSQTEEYWRNRRKEAEAKVAELQSEYDRIQSELNALQTAISATGGGLYEGNQAADEFRKRMTERDEVKQKLEDAKAAVSDLEDEARKSGVPPGWVRGE